MVVVKGGRVVLDRRGGARGRRVLLGIDHLVIGVRDPDGAAGLLERRIGLVFTGGGRHEHAGTFNRLAFLGDAYLELIGVFDRDLVLSNPTFAVGRAALALLDAGRQGLATYALATDDIERDVRTLWTDGSTIGEPVAGSRVRPDGGVVRWITAFPALGPGSRRSSSSTSTRAPSGDPGRVRPGRRSATRAADGCAWPRWSCRSRTPAPSPRRTPPVGVVFDDERQAEVGAHRGSGCGRRTARTSRSSP